MENKVKNFNFDRNKYYYDGLFIRKLPLSYLEGVFYIRQEENYHKKIKDLVENDIFRAEVQKRDNLTCRDCKRKGRAKSDTTNNRPVIFVYRAKSLDKMCKELGISSALQASVCEELWNTDNAYCLCVSCYWRAKSWERRKGQLKKNAHIAL